MLRIMKPGAGGCNTGIGFCTDGRSGFENSCAFIADRLSKPITTASAQAVLPRTTADESLQTRKRAIQTAFKSASPVG
jgi:hypothetical protein